MAVGRPQVQPQEFDGLARRGEGQPQRGQHNRADDNQAHRDDVFGIQIESMGGSLGFITGTTLQNRRLPGYGV